MSDLSGEQTVNDTSEGIYDVALMINHPTETPDVITNELGLQPDYKWQVGQPRSAPNGTPLPGLNKDTYWAVAERVSGHKHFFETAVGFLSKLEAAEDFLRNLLASGGRVRIAIHLPGHTNVGDSISPSNLHRMGRLGIQLTIEIFPEMV